MPSLDHEVLVELFRANAALAPALLAACAGLRLEHARAELGTVDLTQAVPTEYRADAVVILRDAAGAAVYGVVVEVQLRPDRAKHWTWPVYVTGLRAALGCGVVLLVVAPDPEVATWARRPVVMGHPGFVLTPLVVGLPDVPWVRDAAEAARVPELAVLSVLAHPAHDTAAAALAAIGALPEEPARLYLDLILSALPAALRAHVEAVMLPGYEYQSEFARKYIGLGREEGRAAGLRAAVIAVAEAKLGPLGADDRAALDGLSDPAQLTALVAALGQARDAAEARAALARARTR